MDLVSADARFTVSSLRDRTLQASAYEEEVVGELDSGTNKKPRRLRWFRRDRAEPPAFDVARWWGQPAGVESDVADRVLGQNPVDGARGSKFDSRR